MKLYVRCARCGGDLEVDPQMVANMAALEGTDDTVLEHAPGQCPGEDPSAPQSTATRRRFRLLLIAVELPPAGDERYEQLGIAERQVDECVRWPDPELVRPGPPPDTDDQGQPPLRSIGLEVLAGIGHTVEARNFPEAVNGDLTGWLSDAWPRFQEAAAYADLPAAPPTPVEGVPSAPSRLIVPGS